MDTATSDIRAVEFAPSSNGDSPILPELPGQIPRDEQINTVTADDACDTRRCHAAITERLAVPFGHSPGPVAFMPSLPIRKNGRPWKEDCPAAKMRGITAFGERIAARNPDRQTAETHIRVALINRFNALGTADIVRVT